MLPIVHGLEKEYGDRISFVRVNILNTDNQAVMEQFGFATTPELYLVDPHGKIIGFWNDFVEKNELQQAFETALRE